MDIWKNGKSCISEGLTGRIQGKGIDVAESILVTSVPVLNAQGEVTAVLFREAHA